MLNVRKSVRAKLGLGLGLTFVLVAALVAVSLGAITLVDRSTTEIYRSNIIGGKAIARSQALLSGLESDIKVALNSSTQAANVRDLPKEIARVRQQVNAAWANYYPALAGQGDEARAAKKTQADLKSIDAALGRFVDTIHDQGTLGAATFYGMSLRQPFQQLENAGIDRQTQLGFESSDALVDRHVSLRLARRYILNRRDGTAAPFKQQF